MLKLSLLAGAIIGLDALFFLLIQSDASLGFAARQGFSGVAFSLGLLLVVVAGAELFTGNNLLAMAWANGKISTAQVPRNRAIVRGGNYRAVADRIMTRSVTDALCSPAVRAVPDQPSFAKEALCD